MGRVLFLFFQCFGEFGSEVSFPWVLYSQVNTLECGRAIGQEVQD